MDPEIIAYWVILAAGILLSGILFVLSARKNGYSAVRALAGYLPGILLAAFFAKALYVLLFYPSLEQYGIEKWIRIIPDEFYFVAGCAGFCLGTELVWLSRKNRKSIPGLMDQLALPGCILAAALRFGEGLLGLAKVSNIGLTELFMIRKGTTAIEFFPLTVPYGKKYLLFCVSTPAALIILLIAVYIFFLRRKARRPFSGIGEGMVFECCAFCLCAERLFLEVATMKTRFYFVFVDQALCGLIIVALMIRMGSRLKKATGRHPTPLYVFMVLCIAVNGITQFLMDKPGKLERLLTEDAYMWFNENVKAIGFAVMLATVIGLAVIYGYLFRKVVRTRRAEQQSGACAAAESCQIPIPPADKTVSVNKR
ncbi:MAG: hypothetical protein IKE15_05285 [Clostridia bacterium]|nr:hypothetical protein [Clostridia bacterium]